VIPIVTEGSESGIVESFSMDELQKELDAE